MPVICVPADGCHLPGPGPGSRDDELQRGYVLLCKSLRCCDGPLESCGRRWGRPDPFSPLSKLAVCRRAASGEARHSFHGRVAAHARGGSDAHFSVPSKQKSVKSFSPFFFFIYIYVRLCVCACAREVSFFFFFVSCVPYVSTRRRPYVRPARKARGVIARLVTRRNVISRTVRGKERRHCIYRDRIWKLWQAVHHGLKVQWLVTCFFFFFFEVLAQLLWQCLHLPPALSSL